jgi:hypothetical protein
MSIKYDRLIRISNDIKAFVRALKFIIQYSGRAEMITQIHNKNFSQAKIIYISYYVVFQCVKVIGTFNIRSVSNKILFGLGTPYYCFPAEQL